MTRVDDLRYRSWLTAEQHAWLQILEHFAPEPAVPTVTKVREWLERITFRPDTRITADESYDQWCVRLTIERWVPDSTAGLTFEQFVDPRHHILIRGKATLPVVLVERDDFDEFVRYLEHELRKLERHEFDEWFRVDGKLIHDPHAQEGRS